MLSFSFLSPYIALLAVVVGLWAAAHIFRKKRTKTKMVCPLRADCDKVVHSTHATTLGIPNELLGIAYYIIIGALYAITIVIPGVAAIAWLPFAILLLSLCAVLFSLYLIALQAIVIRAWCSWCMLSALANIVLALCLFALPTEGLFELLSSQRTLWIIAHSFGFILGVGGATITDVFFFRFLKDHRITDEEKGTLNTLTSIIWCGLAVLVISGLMLFLPEQARLSESPKFLVKVVVVGVIIVNGIALNLLVAPRMHRLSFESTKPERHFRRLAFALGGVSIVSWYLAFILGSLRNIGSYSFEEGVIGYLAILAAVVIGSQIFERLAVKQYHAIPERGSTEGAS